MNQIEGNIEYKLTIDPKGENHGYEVKSTVEHDIVAMMMTFTVLSHELKDWKQYKAKAEGQNKKSAGAQIAKTASLLRGLQGKLDNLLGSYYEYKEFQRQQEEYIASQKAEGLTELGVLPKQEEI